jgi:hypothetical protein
MKRPAATAVDRVLDALRRMLSGLCSLTRVLGSLQQIDQLLDKFSARLA